VKLWQCANGKGYVVGSKSPSFFSPKGGTIMGTLELVLVILLVLFLLGGVGGGGYYWSRRGRA
jgi:hypothetical protein